MNITNSEHNTNIAMINQKVSYVINGNIFDRIQRFYLSEEFDSVDEFNEYPAV